MKTCQHCDGDLLRHGVTYYRRDPSIVGVRYICRDCRTSFTQRVDAEKPSGYAFFNQTGRPYNKDWRMAV